MGKDVAAVLPEPKTVAQVAREMMEFYRRDPRRINHFLKVYGFAKTIGELEGLDPETQQTLEVAALTHDIGIKPAEQKYGSGAGHYQELEGPPVARELLGRLSLPPALVDRVCYLISRHHTYTDIEGLDYQILVEADFLVNIFEGEMAAPEIASVRQKIFRTQAGLRMLEQLYDFGG